MSWTTAVVGEGLRAERSTLDTRRFGMRVSRVTVADEMADPVLDDLIDAVRGQSADVCIVRYPARETAWFSGLLAAGFRVLLADTLVYWRLPVGAGRQMDPPESITSRVEALPSHVVDDMVEQIFDGYRSHYSANPVFDPMLALAGYQDWARSASAGDDLVSLWMADQPIGFASFEVEGAVEEILLAGIVRSQQGQGLYPHLLAGVERQAASRGVTDLVISTQGHNVGVQRAWARYGFEPASSLVTLHVMPAGEAPSALSAIEDTSLTR